MLRGVENTMRLCATTLASELADDELACLREVMSGHQFEKSCLEIGTAAGGTLLYMMRCYETETRPSFVVVDPMTYFPSQFEKVKENLLRNNMDPKDVDFRIKTSMAALKESTREGEVFDFIFIDANHKCRHVLQDLFWSNLLRDNGLLVLHDYCPKTPGVMWAAERFLKRNPQYTKKMVVNRLLVIQKTPSLRSTKISWVDRIVSVVLTQWIQWKQSIRKRLQKRALSAH